MTGIKIVTKTQTSRDRKNGATPVQPGDLKRREKVAAAIVLHCKDIKRPKRVNDTENDVRRSKLEEDKWTTNVRPLFVDCRGCGKTIKLDGRNPEGYYRTNWMKHKKICRIILETERRQMSGFVPECCIFQMEPEKTSAGSPVAMAGDKLSRPLTNYIWKQTSYCPGQRSSHTTSTMRPATWTDDGIELEDELYFSDPSVTAGYFGNTGGIYTNESAYHVAQLHRTRTASREIDLGTAYPCQLSKQPYFCQTSTWAPYNSVGVYDQMQENEWQAVEFLTYLRRLKGG